MKILLVGLGKWGQNHLITLKELGVQVLTCDIDITKQPDTTDYRKLLDKVDAVDVVTPADTHYDICMTCLHRGKDVFVEKPISITSLEAFKLIEDAGWKDLIFQVGHVFRYHSVFEEMKETIKTVGNVKYVYGHFMNKKKARTDVGVTHTDSIHFFDLFNWLFGGVPDSVLSVVKGIPLDDTSISILNYDGKVAVVESSCVSPQKRDIAVIGNTGDLYFDFLDPKYASDKPLTKELSDFVNSVETRRKPVADGKCGYDALRVVEACYLSSKEGKRIYL